MNTYKMIGQVHEDRQVQSKSVRCKTRNIDAAEI